jgi:hypothetical protein
MWRPMKVSRKPIQPGVPPASETSFRLLWTGSTVSRQDGDRTFPVGVENNRWFRISAKRGGTATLLAAQAARYGGAGPGAL